MSDTVGRLNAAFEGRYRVERELGEGGMATVFLAEDLKHHRKVAIKVLKPELALAVGSERFLAEIETTANLLHPHILPLFDSGEADGFLFYVMPYVDGESLRERLDRDGRLPVDDAVSIARTVAGALQRAHEQGVIHRDIKPANILLSDGEPLVADFGIALVAREIGDGRLTATGLSLGTPAYMSPEQVGGETRVDARADVYSLGSLLYEMLAGEPPFAGPTYQSVVARALTEPPPEIRSVRREVPDEVAAVIDRALQKDPAERFLSARAFGEALAVPGPTAAPRRRTPAVVSLVAVAAMIGVGFMALRAVRASNARGSLPEIASLVKQGDYVTAYDLAVQAERWVAVDPALGESMAEAMAEASDLLTVTSDPSGADVFIQRFEPDPANLADSQFVGTTPIEDFRVPRADHRVVIAMDGYVPAERISSSEYQREGARPAEARRVRLEVQLLTPDESPSDMVFVPGGEYRMASPDAPTGATVTLVPYFIDRHEVTNQAFKGFLDGGGYSAAAGWPALPPGLEREFTDRTGLPGPRDWVRQEFPEGEERFPVSGVTWYEAQAFCRSQGKRLPTAFEWEKTARDGRTSRFGVLMPWGVQRSSAQVGRRANFYSAGAGPVDEFPFGIGPYGAYGMAGNLREWTANPMGDGFAVTGGSWGGPSYLYPEYGSESGALASPTLGFRCARSTDLADPDVMAIDADTRTPAYEPVGEGEFSSLLAHYRYDPRPANPRVSEVVETAGWTRERIWIDGPQADSILLYFYAPKNAEPPYQTIAYVPGSSVFFTVRVPDATEWVIGPVIQGGRALLVVVLTGMIERGFPAGVGIPDPPTVGFRDLMVLHATELRLGMDYAESRPDVDGDRFAYVGLSFGAGSRLPFSAVDDRYKSVVYLGGGIDERVKPTLPEADNVNFAPYVSVPKILINGASDEEHPWLSRGLPLWELLREPKELLLVEGGGHLVPLEDRIPAINDFLDRTLGPVGSR